MLGAIELGTGYGADVHSLPAELTVCFNSRGYAEPSCNGFDNAATVTLIVAGEPLYLTIYPLGQMVPS